VATPKMNDSGRGGSSLLLRKLDRISVQVIDFSSYHRVDFLLRVLGAIC
jgi:hypothetical protein